MDDFSAFIPKVEWKLIPVKDLVSNQDYQRNISMIHVKKAAENFDLRQVNPIKISRRNGVNYIFNGQHTAEILAMASGSRDVPVWCMIFNDLDYTEEADIFANQMKHVKPLLPIEIFNANCEAGNNKELMIRGLVESYDLKISAASKPGCITAVSSLERIYDKYGYDVLDRTIKLIIITWEGEQKSFSANMLNGIARLIVAFGDDLKDNVFKEKLGEVSLKEIARTAKERRAGSLGYAEALLVYYNKKMRSPLRWNNLYSIKTSKEQSRKSDIE